MIIRKPSIFGSREDTSGSSAHLGKVNITTMVLVPPDADSYACSAHQTELFPATGVIACPVDSAESPCLSRGLGSEGPRVRVRRVLHPAADAHSAEVALHSSHSVGEQHKYLSIGNIGVLVK